MRLRSGGLSVLALTSLCGCWCAVAQVPRSDAVLPGVRANLTDLEQALPDFIVEESVLSVESKNGKALHETRTVSELTCIKQILPAGAKWNEARNVVALDGKPVAKGAHIKAPITLGGGFIGALTSTFSVANDAFQVFSVSRFEPSVDKYGIVLDFATKNDQTGMRTRLNNRFYLSKDTGQAWIDPMSMQVVRFVRRYGNLPGALEIDFQEDFAETVLNGKAYWLPGKVTASDSSRGRTYAYTATYANYRKFTASSSVTFQN